jgi:hypothetical protein
LVIQLVGQSVSQLAAAAAKLPPCCPLRFCRCWRRAAAKLAAAAIKLAAAAALQLG